MGHSGLVVLFGSAIMAWVIGPDVIATQGASADDRLSSPIDFDPLQQFLPRDDLYMQVPGGVLAVEDTAAPGDTIEQRAQGRNGGLVVGYCLRASCSRVTHLAVLQVCGNQVGGPADANRLILGVVRLPYGHTPGYLKSLQGRDYAAHRPFTQGLTTNRTEDVPSLYTLSAVGKGPVASFEWAEPSNHNEGNGDTLALRMTMVRDPSSGMLMPHFEVRHLCQQHIS